MTITTHASYILREAQVKPTTRKHIKELYGITTQQIDDALSRLLASNQIVRVRHGVYALPWDKTITPSDMDRDVRILRWLLDHGQDLTAEEAGLHLGEAPEVATDRLERIHGAYRYFHIDGARRVRWSKLRPRNPHTAFMVKYYNRRAYAPSQQRWASPKCRALLQWCDMPSQLVADHAGCERRVANRIRSEMSLTHYRPKAADVIYPFITKGEASRSAICAAFPEYTTGTVASALRRLLRDGRVYRVSKGVYAVTELPASILALIKQRGPMKGRDISKALDVKRSVVSDALTDMADSGSIVWEPGQVAQPPTMVKS